MGKGKKITKTRRERMAKALDLREQGATYDMIASNLGISRTLAYNDVQDALREITREPAENLLKLELARLDKLWIRPYREGLKGDLKAAQTALKIHERRCKLLGLEVTKVDVAAPVLDSLAASFQLLDEMQLEGAAEGD